MQEKTDRSKKINTIHYYPTQKGPLMTFHCVSSVCCLCAHTYLFFQRGNRTFIVMHQAFIS